MTDKKALADAIEKHRDVIAVWMKGSDPFKAALAETIVGAAQNTACINH